MREIARLERRIVLPGGARPDLAFYDRRYAGVVEHGRRLVIGLLRRLGDASGHAAIVPPSRLPVIADAGCAALTLRYDPAAADMPEVACTSRLPPRAPIRP